MRCFAAAKLCHVTHKERIRCTTWQCQTEMFTQRRSEAKSVGCFQRRLFVCLFVDTLTSERLNIGWWNLHCTKISVEFEFGGHSPGVHTAQNVALDYNFGKLSTGCLVSACFWKYLAIRLSSTDHVTGHSRRQERQLII